MDSAVAGDNNRGALLRREGIGGVRSNDNLPKQSCHLLCVHENLGMTLVHAQETARTIAMWIQPWWVVVDNNRGALSRCEGIGGVGRNDNQLLSCHLVSVHENLGMKLMHAQETAGTIAPWIQPWWALTTEVHCQGVREMVVWELTTIS